MLHSKFQKAYNQQIMTLKGFSVKERVGEPTGHCLFKWTAAYTLQTFATLSIGMFLIQAISQLP